MNTSPRVDPVNCRTCGQCCKTFRLWYPDGLPREKYDEMIRIVYSIDIKARIIRVQGGNWLQFDHPCAYLKFEAGKYSCELYDDPCRPSICAIYPYAETTRDDCPHLIEVS